MSKLKLPSNAGFASQLREGYNTLDNVLESLTNRCFQLASLVKPFFGPLGLKVMTVNKLERAYITSDCHKIFDQIEMGGPDCKIFLDAINMQYEEAGDGCKLLILFGCELISELKALVAQGITRNEALDTFSNIYENLPKFINEVESETIETLSNKAAVVELIKIAIAPKTMTHVDLISNLIYEACLNAMFPSDNKTKARDFGAESVRVTKIYGGSLSQSYVMPGMLLDGKPENLIHSQEKCKVAVYNVGFDYNATESSATVLFKSSAEIAKYSNDEDKFAEQLVKSIADTGVKVVICSGKSSNLMLHYANKYDIMVLSVSSKWVIRRLCVSLDAKPMIKMEVPRAENLGYADKVHFSEINEQEFIEIRRKDSIISTIVLYGTTEQLVAMVEEAISSGVNLLKVLAKDPRMVAGAGVFEIQLAKVIRNYGSKHFSGDIKSYVYNSVALALEKTSKMLIENTGTPRPGEMIASLFEKHRNGIQKAGFSVDSDGEVQLVDDIVKSGVKDPLYTKMWAMKYALGSLDQICRVDMIIMARESDFKLQQRKDWDDGEKDL